MKVAAVILAAGFGSRMQQYTKNMAKPLLPVGEKSIIEYTLQQLSGHGICDIGINTHYFAEQVQSHLGDGSRWKSQIHYIYEKAPSGTAGGVKKLSSFLTQFEHFIVVYGDLLTDLNFSELVKFHLHHDRSATVCLHRRSKSNSIVEFDHEQIVRHFIERPNEEQLQKMKSEFWVNSGVYCFKKSILDLIPETDAIVDFPKDIFPMLIAQEQLMAFPINCNRIAIDTEDKYLEAQRKIKEFKFVE